MQALSWNKINENEPANESTSPKIRKQWTSVNDHFRRLGRETTVTYATCEARAAKTIVNKRSRRRNAAVTTGGHGQVNKLANRYDQFSLLVRENGRYRVLLLLFSDKPSVTVLPACRCHGRNGRLSAGKGPVTLPLSP